MEELIGFLSTIDAEVLDGTFALWFTKSLSRGKAEVVSAPIRDEWGYDHWQYHCLYYLEGHSQDMHGPGNYLSAWYTPGQGWKAEWM